MNFIKKAKDIIYRNLFDDDLEMWHKLLNLILMALLLGTFISLTICVIADMNPIGNLTMAVVLLVILFALWLSNGRKNPKLAAIFVTALTNFILMPILYVYNGGLHSGMPIWQLMGLLFSWLVLKGKIGVIMFILNYSVALGTIGFGMMFPEKIHPLGSDTLVAIDIAQSVFVATCIIGIIFKYNSYIYEKQRKHLMEQDMELRNAVEDAKKANQAKSDFLAHMSHEIRTPINSVLGMDEMILRETTEPEIAEYATNIQSAGHTLLSIINDILDFSKIESGKMEIIPSEYHMMSLLNDCYNLVAMRAKEKDIKIIFQNNESLPSKLYGDEVRIRQIILNLMTNGVKYTKEGSVKLSIDWERKNDDEMLLKISVTDTGSGISQENMNKLFKSFQRIEEKKNRNVEGTGLGLTITKQLIDLMNGTITVESEYGKGSTFYVEVPQAIVSEKPLGNFASKYVYNVTSGKEIKRQSEKIVF